MNFNNLHGSVNSVSLKVYDDLINLYVDKIKNVVGVKSIIQIGSFSTPGLSDIDIIVIVDDFNPPKWQDISIKNNLKGEKGFEVIAHDIFVYPYSIIRYIDGLFYIDQKKLLYGEDIGGGFSHNEINYLRLILSFEYTVNRLESLVMLTSLKRVHVRNVLLFISTLRHTNKLLCDFNIITKNELIKRNSKIEFLRKSFIDNTSSNLFEDLNSLIIPSFKTIYNSILLLKEKLDYIDLKRNKKWVLNFKKLVFEIDNTKTAANFFKSYRHLNNFFSGSILIQPMPTAIRQHIHNYEKIKFLSEFQNYNDRLKKVRFELALSHSDFINLNNYHAAKSYTIINFKSPNFKDLVKILFLKVLSIFIKIK